MSGQPAASLPSLAGKVVVVTGATRGIGRAIARSCGAAGADVVISGRSTREAPNRALPGVLEEVQAELEARGTHVERVSGDLSRAEDVERLAAATLQRFGRCDVLVNNAAVSFLGPFLQVPAKRWKTVFEVNLYAPVLLIHAFLPGMIERSSGSVINIGSGAAQPQPGASAAPQLPYTVTKAGLEALTVGLAYQLQADAHPIAVNCIRIDEVVPTEAVTYHASSLAEGARHQPDDLGDATVWLAGQAPHVTGRIFTLAALRESGALRG